MMKDYRIWVTGASRGIGLAIASRLSQTDATVILSSRKPSSYDVIKENIGMKPNVFFFPCDVSKRDAVKNVYEKISISIGEVNILINNAGIGIFKEFSDMDEEDFDSIYNSNVKGVFNCTQVVLPGMIIKKKGIIINISSIAVKTNFPQNTLYASTKAAAHSMISCLREEVRGKGIKVINFVPGATETEIWSPNVRDKFADVMMKPEDVAEAVYHSIEMCSTERAMPEEIILRPQLGDL